MTSDHQRAEGALIAQARSATGISGNKAAAEAGMSPARWRQIENGYQLVSGVRIPVVGRPETLARMARAVGVTAEQLAQAGRQDAAEVLSQITPPAALGDLEVGWFDELRDIPDEVLAAEVARRLLGSHLSQQNPVEDAVRIHGALTALFDRPSTLVTSLTERRDRAAGAAGQQTVEDELPEEFEEAAYRPAQPPGPVEE